MNPVWAEITLAGFPAKVTRVQKRGRHFDGTALLVIERPLDGRHFFHHTELQIRILPNEEIPNDWFASTHQDRLFLRRT